MFFKKTTDKKRINNIKSAINAYHLNGLAITDYIRRIDVDDKTVDIALRLPNTLSEQDAEQMHRELSEQLLAFGVDLVNMDVVLTSQSHNTNTRNTSTHNISEPSSVQSFEPARPVFKSASKSASHKQIFQNKPVSQNEPQAQSPNLSQNSLPQDRLPPHPRIRHIIAVASGKGGVGKSTTAVNLALALKHTGAKVGMLDADIYGPSLPTMLGIAGQKPLVEDGQFVPLDGFGMPIISIGSLLDDEHTPIAWRGIKATGALMQLYNQTDFPSLDYLIIDMPPGTGDIALTLAQKIPITCAIIVTTPQHIALLDVKKGLELFIKTHIPVLGVVENMAVYTCKHCGATEAIFGGEGVDTMSQHYGVPLLGQLPLDGAICQQMDKGDPMPILAYYQPIAQSVIDGIDKFGKARDEKRIF